ncbi:MAG: DUF2207 domain-containing protein [Candidatus Buchananbacteria bacterium]
MKKLILFFSIFGLLIAGPALAQEKIDNYSVQIKINQDASLDIQENISYNFGDQERHGIYRDIPISYRNSFGNFNLKISAISVVNEAGQAYNFTINNKGSDKSIKIGDADKLVSGIKTYIIKYKINRAINYFDDHDEIYWNAIGGQWQIPIDQAKVDVIFDSNFDKNLLQTKCYFGVSNSQTPCDVAGISDDKNPGAYFSQTKINPGDYLTIVVGFPKNIVSQPSWQQNFIEAIQDNIILFLPIGVFIIVFIVWYKKGRDPKGRGTIITQFDVPDNLTPAEVGLIVDGRLSNFDISSEIIYLATQDYIKIHQIPDKSILDKFSKTDNYILEKIDKPENFNNEFDGKILSSLFSASYLKEHEIDGQIVKGTKLSSFKEEFAKDLKEIKKTIFAAVTEKGYFASNPNTTRGVYVGLGVVVIFFSFVFGGAFGVSSVISLGLCGIIILLFGIIMPKMTQKGVLTKEYILGLKNYLNVAEKDRLNFHNAPEKKPETFEKLLPFAMALNVEKQWAKQFEDIYKQNPDWYVNSTNQTFNAIIFSNNLRAFSTATNSMFQSTSQAASGGSGFSGGGGGGFGGGGGGSW